MPDNVEGECSLRSGRSYSSSRIHGSSHSPINYAERCKELGKDTAVRCSKCGHIQYLNFADGLKSGWSKCHGLTMTIVFTHANIKKAVTKVIDSLISERKLITAQFTVEASV